ncbi:MAG: SpoIVB peptidase [Clostridia bacterium]|nr:SpoIVB peptidase [Clostridia bacterium]
MQRKRQIWLIGLILVALVLVSCFTFQVPSLLTLPTQQKLTVGDEFRLNLPLPNQIRQRLQVYVEKDPSGILASKSNVAVNSVYSLEKGLPEAISTGKIFLQVRLFGVIPIKRLVVDVIPQLKVIPGGHSIGVMLSSPGVMVVGYAPLMDEQNQKHYPAKDAGIEIGDVVLSINGQKIDNEHDMAVSIEKFGRKGDSVTVEIRRNGQNRKIQVKPRYCNDSASYRVGLYVRDSAAGVGTLTFIDPGSHKFGALGHIITDADTNQPIDVGKGRIIRANIQQIQKGRKGQPGEKVGVFIEDSGFSGKITQNTQVGIFGKTTSEIANPLYPEPIPVATGAQLRLGEAEILTVVNGEKIERYKVVIRKLLPPGRPDGKGMIIEITDDRLINKTGGIIQGMSGSPIIQNGRLVGAVTHVFINNPRMGYGVLIEKMLLETGILEEKKEKVS